MVVDPDVEPRVIPTRRSVASPLLTAGVIGEGTRGRPNGPGGLIQQNQSPQQRTRDSDAAPSTPDNSNTSTITSKEDAGGEDEVHLQQFSTTAQFPPDSLEDSQIQRPLHRHDERESRKNPSLHSLIEEELIDEVELAKIYKQQAAEGDAYEHFEELRIEKSTDPPPEPRLGLLQQVTEAWDKDGVQNFTGRFEFEQFISMYHTTDTLQRGYHRGQNP